ncbi:hypothetical protein KsCSTR_49300 [Candidatus Kuenenia stuttgartiensis]|jgi:hypothetical protein|uniref:Uncharacterized protein n=1 Tax=Kuenenia stuttgartiensis TaxID=174633 RepID=A0A6G7GYM4_KUEST|nr:hypothetical protein KsCSTR_49300 [Candidatus Kuenenia stuttgartiensis]
MTGRPYGNDGFMKKLETLFGRRLRDLPWGRSGKTNKYSMFLFPVVVRRNNINEIHTILYLHTPKT